jgi:hypothetical protein
MWGRGPALYKHNYLKKKNIFRVFACRFVTPPFGLITVAIAKRGVPNSIDDFLKHRGLRHHTNSYAQSVGPRDLLISPWSVVEPAQSTQPVIFDRLWGEKSIPGIE